MRKKPMLEYRNLSLFISFFTIIQIGISSCCTKKYCPGADDIGPIELLNFSVGETDSVYLVFYNRDSGFETVADSFMLEINQPLGSDKFYAYPSRIISVDFNYRMYFTRIDKTYEISEFITSKSVCNNCFLTTDYYTTVEAYQVNGKRKESHSLQIDKLTD